MKKVDIVVGLQWGDEGKGKVVHYLSSNYDVVVRYQGGANAGHTTYLNGTQVVCHLLPSGILLPGKIVLLGDGMVIDPVLLKKEVEAISSICGNVEKRIFLGGGAHLVLPTHYLLDDASEKYKGKKKIGTTRRGIAPAYMDRTGRNGIPVAWIHRADLLTEVMELTEKHIRLLAMYEYDVERSEIEEKVRREWWDALMWMRSFQIVDSSLAIKEWVERGMRLLLEGAQGTLLDINRGTYPYVTSSSTTVGGALAALGIPPAFVGEVYGVAKCYCTRVGEGPFPTEAPDEEAILLREKGKEYGATTGRPRRCGWLDLPALRYAIHVNGVSRLILTKVDVLAGFQKIPVCDFYLYGEDGKEIKVEVFSPGLDYSLIKPHYIIIDGCHDISTLSTKLSKLIEQETGTRVHAVSTGPEPYDILVFNSDKEPV